ncbi:MAG: NADH-quinone oxidoreductase subunit L [Actinomycetia bacterium]|nr:NADH-quinone oxidoreductase subunit L [Actinomycetes bacterium]
MDVVTQMDFITQLNLAVLIVLPVIAAGIMLLVRNAKVRGGLVVVLAALIILASLAFGLRYITGGSDTLLIKDAEWLGYIALAIDIICCVYIIAKGIIYKRFLAVLMALVQGVVVVCLEIFWVHHALESMSHQLYIDGLSAIMVLVIGIIGSGICIYANGYMVDFQKHEDEHGKKDRRPVFFALMFVFLSAMFIIVLSNDLTWLLTGWEVTTVCSFALIGYTRTDEAIRNSFRQIYMNLLGGIAFSVALVILASGAVAGTKPTLELSALIAQGPSVLVMLPVMLLALAGFTKAAQMPFHTWLLGAMVAPTPTSALLHSSTMVKAGVFMLIKLAPCLGITTATGLVNFNGWIVVLVGGVTFLGCSCLAISQSNAKRVLAYSTIANLGLIVACAGVGTPEAVWAAIFLLIFHAAAKSLLFLCVGTTEHHIGSRDIESMDELFDRLPNISRFTALGILCMFVAPFGMLISKWATIVSLAETGNMILLVILAFGSAATFMFWSKWLGKIIAVSHASNEAEKGVHKTEWFSLALMAFLAFAMCVFFPLISEFSVVPYLKAAFPATLLTAAISLDNLIIMAVIALLLLAIFAIQFFRPRSKAEVGIYLAGVGTNSEEREYTNSLSQTAKASQRNWYLDKVFGEKALYLPSYIVTIALLVIGLAAAISIGLNFIQI